MVNPREFLTALLLLQTTTVALPAGLVSRSTNHQLSNPHSGPVPGESPLYSHYRGTKPPFPASHPVPIHPTAKGAPGPDDLLFQNLLSAEWIIYSFYQYGVERFNESSFTALGLPNTTYQRIQEIRDNEAGHLRIFQDAISPTSLKPGPCKYDYPFETAQDFVAAIVEIELGSQIFLTGLATQAKLTSSKETLVAVGETETRHNTWALIDVFGADPFAGPVDTAYPYANQILETTRQFIVAGSCPSLNPEYPSPSQKLPQLGLSKATRSVLPGSEIQISFTQAENQPAFDPGKEYYAVFSHAVDNITAPFDTKTNSTTVPAAFEKGKGAIVMVIADEKGAPRAESCVAGPLLIFEQPARIRASEL